MHEHDKNFNSTGISQKPLELDAARMKLTKDGIVDYYWPVANIIRENFYYDLFDEYNSHLTQYSAETDDSMVPYKIWAKDFICETVGVFWGDILSKGFKASSYAPIVPSHFRLWRALFENRIPEEFPFLIKIQRLEAKQNNVRKIITKTYSNLKKLPRLLRWNKGGFSVDGMKITPITTEVLQKSIIVTQRSHLLHSQVLAAPDSYVFCRSDRWYGPVDTDSIPFLLEKNNKAFESLVMSTIEKLYRKHGYSLTAESRIYIASTLSKGAAVIREHYTRLGSKSLPKKMWTGSGGNIWDNMLRIATRKQGGHAVGHDHGAGLAHTKNAYMGFLEFWGCDRFVTFNDNQADELAKNETARCRLDGTLPEIKGKHASIPKQRIIQYSRFLSPQFKPKTIAIMADIYDGDRGRGGPYSPDIMHVDWQARLISHLREWGYQVIIKIHPESKTLPPKAFEEQLGASIRSDKIEGMLDELDLLFFDTLYTTAFRSALTTNIPVTFVDFYNHPWTEKGLDLVKKRTGFLEGFYDSNNRAQVHWDTLKAAIELSPEKSNNHEFFDYYYA